MKGELAGAVRRPVREPALPRRRRDVHDVAIRAPNEMMRGFTGNEHRAEDVGLPDSEELFGR